MLLSPVWLFFNCFLLTTMQKIDKFADFGRKIVAIGRNYS